MKTIGIVGGLGPEATMDYYKELIKCSINDSNENVPNYPEIIIYSLNLSHLMRLMQQGNFEEATLYLVKAVESLKKSGADFVAISANTPHLFFSEIQSRSSIPLLSIVNATLEVSIQMQMKRMALIGTKFTMQQTFYQNEFQPAGIELFVPDQEEIEIIHHKLFTEIELGVFKDETRQLYLDIIQRMKNQYNLDGVILGCTEFPLLLKEKSYLGIPFLNTTRIHVEKIYRIAKS